MFKNREFTVRMNKADRNKDTNVTCDELTDFDEKVAAAMILTKTAARYIAVGVCGYVVLDTYRQVLIARNTNIPQN